MTDQQFCGNCGTQRQPGAAFCAKCGASFGPVPMGNAVSHQQGLAQGLQQIEYMRMKLIVGRLIGIAIGLVLWWVILGPLFGDNPLLVAVSLVVVLFGGLYVGQMVVLSMVANRK